MIREPFYWFPHPTPEFILYALQADKCNAVFWLTDLLIDLMTDLMIEVIV